MTTSQQIADLAQRIGQQELTLDSLSPTSPVRARQIRLVDRLRAEYRALLDRRALELQ